MSERNKAAARRFYEEAFNKGNLEAINDIIAPDCTHSDPAMPHVKSGIEPVRRMVMDYRAGFPDLHFTIEDCIAEGDMVVLRWNVKGTHTETLLGVAATNRSIDIPGIVILKFRDGKAIDSKVVWDALGFHMQLGLAGTMATATA